MSVPGSGFCGHYDFTWGYSIKKINLDLSSELGFQEILEMFIRWIEVWIYGHSNKTPADLSNKSNHNSLYIV